MNSTHESTAARPEPVGNLCVVRDETLNSWSVMICPGLTGKRKPLGKFGTRGEAEAFAHKEILRMNAESPGKRIVLHVDDCPCWQKQL